MALYGDMVLVDIAVGGQQAFCKGDVVASEPPSQCPSCSLKESKLGVGLLAGVTVSGHMATAGMVKPAPPGLESWLGCPRLCPLALFTCRHLGSASPISQKLLLKLLKRPGGLGQPTQEEPPSQRWQLLQKPGSSF